CVTFVQNQALYSKQKKVVKYSNELKQFCLELYFKGPKVYRQLETIFHLPTKRTLNRYIQNCTFQAGINEHLFNTLLINISDLEELDKYCVLCFDEMALKSHLYYNISEDKLETIFHLPTKRTLNRYIQNCTFQAGINEHLFNTLLINISDLEELDKYCVLCFDEMTLKSHLYYNISEDKVLGFTDLGDQRLFEPCSSATVFLIRGIYKNWKQPISYLLPRTSCTAAILKSTLLQCIKKLKEIGLIVCIVVCDMGSNKVALCNLLRITPENPFFFVDDQKVFFAYDTCHLLKATRNNLLLHSYRFDNNFTSWKYISDFYNNDKAKTN
ncbi:THAP domain-containing protein, partial [Ooceraea biroi]